MKDKQTKEADSKIVQSQNDKVAMVLNKDNVHEALYKLFHDKAFSTSKEIK